MRQLGFTGTGEAFQDHQGLLISRRGTADFTTTFDNSSLLQVTFLSDYDRLKTPWGPGPIVFPAGQYEWLTTKASYSSDQSKRVSGSLGIETGGYYRGDKRTYKVTAPFRTLLVETTYQRNRVDVRATAPYITTTLSNRISYSFSPALFAKSFVQYNSDRKLATVNLLLWYIYRPGSDLYVVYNQGWDTDLPEAPFRRARNRSLSVKLTWWWSR